MTSLTKITLLIHTRNHPNGKARFTAGLFCSMPTSAPAGQQRGVVAGRVPAIDADGEFQQRQVEEIDNRHPTRMQDKDHNFLVSVQQWRDHGTASAKACWSVKTVRVVIKPQIVEDKPVRANRYPNPGSARSRAGKPIFTQHIDMPGQIDILHPLLAGKQHIIGITRRPRI